MNEFPEELYPKGMTEEDKKKIEELVIRSHSQTVKNMKDMLLKSASWAGVEGGRFEEMDITSDESTLTVLLRMERVLLEIVEAIKLLPMQIDPPQNDIDFLQ